MSPQHSITSLFSSSPLGYDKPDWENFSETDLQEHLENISALLADKICGLSDQNQILTTDTERELYFMLSALLQAKQARMEAE